MAIITGVEAVKQVLLEHKTIAVLGAHAQEHKAAHYVPRYLHGQDYAIYPVNPVFSGETLFGQEVVSNLSDLETAIDIVNIFRRSAHLPDHVGDILAMDPLPAVVWLQLGVRHDEVAEQLGGAGVDVIQDRCMLADHQRLL